MASSFTPEEHPKFVYYKQMMNALTNFISCLSVKKDKIQPELKETLPEFESKIHSVISHWRKVNEKSNKNIQNDESNTNIISTVQGESTPMHSNINLIQANQHPVEKLNNSPISSSQVSKNLPPQKDQLDAETPSPIVASLSQVNGSKNSPGQSALHTQSPVVPAPEMHPSSLQAETTLEAQVDELNMKALPMDRLMAAIKSLSPQTLSSAAIDISGVVGLSDRMHSCNPQYMVSKNQFGSRCEIREDLSLSARCHVQSEKVMPQYMVRTDKFKRDITSTSHLSEGYDLGNYALHTSEKEMTVSSCAKRQKTEINRSLQEEIVNINQKLFNIEVEIEENVADYHNVILSAVGEGTFIKCSFTPITYSSDMKSLLSSSEYQVMPLNLQIPSSYPDSSPTILKCLPDAELHGKDSFNGVIHSRLERSIRCIPHPMSLEEIARAWSSTVQDVIMETLGGCTFTSYYGSWQNILPL